MTKDEQSRRMMQNEKTGQAAQNERISRITQNERINRITQNEKYLDESAEAVQKLRASLDAYLALREDRALLYAYYGSPEWFSDKAAQESGQLPPDLKCGVLSEDAVYDLITAERELKECLSGLLAPVCNDDAD